MPRAFSEHERATIRAQLLARGRLLLASYGIRRTTIEDLIAGVGISKGAFYLFFDSKEELFFEVLRGFEADYQAALIDALGPPELAPAERLSTFVAQAISTWRSNPLFQRFGREEYELLARRLSPELLAAGMQDDVAFAGRLLERWASQGLTVRAEPSLLAGLMRAIFYVTLHADEFDRPTYQATIARLIQAIAADLTSHG